MLAYQIVNDLCADDPRPGDVFTLLDRAIRAYRLILSDRGKALRVRRNGETMDLILCLPTSSSQASYPSLSGYARKLTHSAAPPLPTKPGGRLCGGPKCNPVREDVMVLDFLDRPDWRADRAVKLTARTLADKLHIRYCLFRGCILPVPVTDKLPRNLRDLRLWSTVPGDPATAVRWVEVAGVGRLSPGEFRRRYRTQSGVSFTYPLVLRLTAHVRRPNGRCRDIKLLPWEFHLMARAREEGAQ